MKEKNAAGFFLEAFVVVVILGTLSAIAMPSIGQLFGSGKTESYEAELINIQTAVTEMLTESANGTLKPVSSVADMSQVQTSDAPPLVLADYLIRLGGTSIKSGCNYTFAADGTVTQILPP